MPLYTPWMAQAGANAGNALAQRGQNRMAADAYMGKPGGMERLMQFNSKLAMEIEQSKTAAEQLKLDRATKLAKEKKTTGEEDQKALNEVAKQVSGMTLEDANAWSLRKSEEIRPSNPALADKLSTPLTAEIHQRIKTAFGDEEKEPTGFQGLVKAYLDAPEGSEEKKLYEDKIRKETAQSGGISIDKDGNVQIGGPASVPKGAKTALFKDVVSNQKGLDSINQIESLYEPEFLTYKGAAKGKWATFLNKLDPEDRSAFQSRRAAFISAANINFLTFRKWATGVAGGEKEMAEIKRATFSEDDSPQDFESKVSTIKSLKRRLNARMKAALAAGVDNQKEFEAYIKDHSLDSIPSIQERGEQLQRLNYDKSKIKAILEQEGYI